MVGHLPAPGVKHGGEADAGCTEKARIARELFESAARGAKECSVGNALVASREGAELLWQREREEEVRHFEPSRRLLGEPAIVLRGLALWAVAIAARARRLVRAATALAVPRDAPEIASAASTEEREDAAVLAGHGGAVASEVLLAVAADDVAEGGHADSALLVACARVACLGRSLRHERIDLGVRVLLPVAGEMEVDRRRLERLVAEVLLDKAEVDAGLEEMGGVAVPQGVDRDAFLHGELLDDTAQGALDRRSGHRLASGSAGLACASQRGEEEPRISMRRPVAPLSSRVLEGSGT